MSTPASALPAAMQQRMVRLQSDMSHTPTSTEATPPGAAVSEPVAPPTAPTGPQPGTTTTEAPTNNGDRVTIGRDEFNDLQAAANRVQQLVARDELNADRMAELTQRLTELEKGDKPSSNTPAATPSASATPAAPVMDTSAIQFSDDENNQYGDSRPYIEKVVDLRLADQLNKLVPGLRQMVEEAKQTATTAVTTVHQQQTRGFLADVKGKVPDMAQLISHKHWGDFLAETNDFAGATYDQLLAHNVRNQNLTGVVKIYDAFREKYVGASQQQQQQTNAGYAGAAPQGGAAQAPQQQPQVAKLKVSDRKKASEDYRKGKITWDQLQEVNKRFDDAEKAGNVDYTA